MEIIQIVGYKNSGKTTFASKLIRYLSLNGIRVGSIKHHGHGGLPAGFENTDSEKHRRAGAVLAGVQGENLLQLSYKKSWSLEKIISIYLNFELDFLVIEGYKSESYRKMVLINDESELSLLQNISNVVAVITDLSVTNLGTLSVPVFDKNDELDKCCKWILENLKNG